MLNPISLNATEGAVSRILAYKSKPTHWQISCKKSLCLHSCWGNPYSLSLAACCIFALMFSFTHLLYFHINAVCFHYCKQGVIELLRPPTRAAGMVFSVAGNLVRKKNKWKKLQVLLVSHNSGQLHRKGEENNLLQFVKLILGSAHFWKNVQCRRAWVVTKVFIPLTCFSHLSWPFAFPSKKTCFTAKNDLLSLPHAEHRNISLASPYISNWGNILWGNNTM